MNDRIDDVARQMTKSEPPDEVAFRRRVLERIDSGDAPPRPWRASFVLTPIAAAAAIVITLFVARQHGPGSPAPGTMTGSVTQAPPSETLAPRASAPAADEPVRLPPSPPGGYGGTSKPDTTNAAMQRLAAARGVAPTSQLEPNDVASNAVAPLAVDTLSQESIQLERLDPIVPIAVAPLDITDTSRRNQ